MMEQAAETAEKVTKHQAQMHVHRAKAWQAQRNVSLNVQTRESQNVHAEKMRVIEEQRQRDVNKQEDARMTQELELRREKAKVDLRQEAWHGFEKDQSQQDFHQQAQKSKDDWERVNSEFQAQLQEYQQELRDATERCWGSRVRMIIHKEPPSIVKGPDGELCVKKGYVNYRPKDS